MDLKLESIEHREHYWILTLKFCFIFFQTVSYTEGKHDVFFPQQCLV